MFLPGNPTGQRSLVGYSPWGYSALIMWGESPTETAHPAQAITETICMSYFIAGDPGKEHGTNRSPPTRRIRVERLEGDRRCESICHPRILLAGIHLDWATCEPLGRTLSQKDRPETARKLIASPQNPRQWAAWPKSPLGLPYTAALHPGGPSQQSLLFCQRVSLDNSLLSVRQPSNSRDLEGGPLSCNNYFGETTDRRSSEKKSRNLLFCKINLHLNLHL